MNSEKPDTAQLSASARPRKRLLLYGGSGSIARAVNSMFAEAGWSVISTGRKPAAAGSQPDQHWVVFDPFAKSFDPKALDAFAPFDAVCWAQGVNTNDSIYDVDADAHLEIYRANCLFNVVTLKHLLDRKLLAPGAKLCVISSIWQNLARQNKLSYSISKAALQGFVLSASVDLAVDGYLINAILPGALDTPMTRSNLQPDQIRKLESSTYFDRLPRLEDVANLALFLCSDRNTGITGQFIAADLGFSHARIL